MAYTNLYELYKQEINGWESVLDAGCGKLSDLVCFEDGPFKIMLGIDREFVVSTYNTYFSARGRISSSPLSLKKFQKRYNIQKTDLLQYNFGQELHNFIICRNVLHFFPDPKKLSLIDQMHTALLNGGLLYLQLHHQDNHHISQSQYATQLGVNIYQNKAEPEKIYYLIEEQTFLKEVRKKYSILNNDVQKNERGLVFVIKKS